MIDNILLGGLVRAIQFALAGAPTYLVGIVIAAAFRFYAGDEGLRKIFDGKSGMHLFKSWLIGMLLPVCSIGVFPIIYELRKAKVRPGSIAAFALSAPLFNPLSMLYGLTLSRPYVILGFALGSLVVVTLLGIIWDRLYRMTSESDGNTIPSVIGIPRLMLAFEYCCQQLASRTTLYAGVAIFGVFLLGCVLPHGALQTSVEGGDWLAPAAMSLVSIFVYSTPMQIMSQLGSMFTHGNSPGAALCLLILGAGINLGTIVWFVNSYGLKQGLTWVAALFFTVVPIAYAINAPLRPVNVEPAGHTHVFDIYTSPFLRMQPLPWELVKVAAWKDVSVTEELGLYGLLALGACAILLKVFFSRGLATNAFFVRGSRHLNQRDVTVTPFWLGVTGALLLVVTSVYSCYIYYPEPTEVLKEQQQLRGDALTFALSHDFEEAEEYIPLWEESTRKLEVGAYLRRFGLTKYQRMQLHILRKQLEDFEHLIEESEVDELKLKEIVRRLSSTQRHLSAAFQH